MGFGYDWRKSVKDEAGFLRYLLMKIRTKTIAKGSPDPLPQLTLLAHSQGGLVTTVAVKEHVEFLEKSRQAGTLRALMNTGALLTTTTPQSLTVRKM